MTRVVGRQKVPGAWKERSTLAGTPTSWTPRQARAADTEKVRDESVDDEFRDTTA